MKTKTHSTRSLNLSLLPKTLMLLVGSTLIGCGDDEPPPPNNPPTVIGAESYALCDRREGDFALVEVNFVIEDLEGSDTLSAPYVEFGALSLPMSFEAIPAPTDEERAAAEEASAGEEGAGAELPACPVESCRARYSWTFSPSDTGAALISCPEDPPQLFIRIADQDINRKDFFLKPRRMD